MSEKVVNLRPDQDYITLQALLQVGGIISTGGMVKAFLLENAVIVNGESENRRGRKLYPNDVVSVLNHTFTIKKP